MTNAFGPFFVVLSAAKRIKKQFIMSASYSDNYFGAYRGNFLGAERIMKMQFFEKRGTFPVIKILRPTFSRIIEYDKPPKTNI